MIRSVCGRTSQLKYPYRTLFVFLLLFGLLLFLIGGTIFKVKEAQELRDWEDMFPAELPPLSYDPEINELMLPMDDPELINYLKERFLKPPPPMSMQYSYEFFSQDDFTATMNLTLKLFDQMLQRRPGFFVDVGAFNGVTASVSLPLERLRRWTGLLVEPDPENFKALVNARRDVFLSQSCLTSTPHARVVSFHRAGIRGHVTEWPVGGQYPGHLDVQCFPLMSYLVALNRTTVDLLYINIGGEADYHKVLEGIPWSRLDITMLWPGLEPGQKHEVAVVTAVSLSVNEQVVELTVYGDGDGRGGHRETPCQGAPFRVKDPYYDEGDLPVRPVSYVGEEKNLSRELVVEVPLTKQQHGVQGLMRKHGYKVHEDKEFDPRDLDSDIFIKSLDPHQ